MQRRDKIKIQELIDLWRYRSKELKKHPKNISKAASYVADSLWDNADQLDKLLKGKPTEAAGFKPKGE